MHLEEVLSRIGNIRPCGEGGFTGKCPAHPDRRNSLSIREGNDGRVLLKCHAGCSVERIAGAMGLGLSDLFPARTTGKPGEHERRITARYPYRDATGNLRFEVVRFEPKEFRQRRPDGRGGWAWNLKGIAPVPYRLPQLLANRGEKIVFICEGEKDVEALVALGFVASTNAGGAGKWRDDYNEHLAGAHVAILPDNDSVGEEHACRIAGKLLSVAASVRIVHLAGLPPKGDVSDWLATGGTPEQLIAEVKRTPALTQETLKKLSPVEPLGRLASDIKPERVRWLIEGFIPLGKLTLLAGDPGQGKSLVTTELAARVSKGTSWSNGPVCRRGSVLVLSAEDSASDTIVPRLQAADADLSLIWVASVENLIALPKEIERLENVIKRDKVRLLVIDPLNSFLGENINTHQDASVRRALAPLAALAGKTGAAVVVVFHLNKDGGREGKAALYRPTGSIGFVAAARAAFLLATNPDNPNQRVFALLKSNLGPPPPSWAFEVRARDFRTDGQTITTARVEWLGPTDLSADDLLRTASRGPRPDKLEGAKALLSEMLGDGGWHPSRSIISAAKENGIAYRTLTDARSELSVLHRKAGFGGGWDWSLPTTHNNSAPSDESQRREGLQRSCRVSTHQLCTFDGPLLPQWVR